MNFLEEEYYLHYNMFLFKRFGKIPGKIREVIYITICFYLNTYFEKVSREAIGIYITICFYLNFKCNFNFKTKQ